MSKTASCSVNLRRFGDLRGVQWRVDLGILPSAPSASVDDLRRITANSRRRYAALRKQLLVDPHVPKDGGSSPDLVMDNPLSQNPDSMWGRFFRNAELERMLDQDLTRLYPERGSYFQTSGCQGMLRRILLIWCLRYPQYGYRQGMHELLAPLLYVLHVDVEHLSEVRKAHEDHFADKFDGFSYHQNDLTFKFDFKKFSESMEDENEFGKSPTKSSSLAELDPAIQTIILLSDAYGPEGELGVVLSENFMEHDAYSMFDALMSGAGGVVAMAEFFSPSPFGSSHTGFAPVIEASSAMYHLLSIVDSSLHAHLVELGVEPQYFSLRWLRVLFGREFSLEDLLLVWDEIFVCDNTKFDKAVESDAESNFGVLDSPRGAFISAFAVSMILKLRSSLLATENATACLQRLLNFPDDVNLEKLIAKAKSLQSMAVDMNNSNPLLVQPGLYDGKKPMIARGHTLSLDLSSPRTPLNVVPDSYWEEKWRVLHKEEEEHRQDRPEKQVHSIRKGWSERVRRRLSRTESDPSPSKKNETLEPSVRRSLLDDLAKQLESDDNNNNNNNKETAGSNVDIVDPVEVNKRQEVADNIFSNTSNDAEIEECSPNFSDPPTPIRGNSEVENESESSSVASNSSVVENDDESCGTTPEFPPLPIIANTVENDDSTRKSATDMKERKILSGKSTADSVENDASTRKSATGMKERKTLSSKFQWLRKLGRNASEGTSERSYASEGAEIYGGESGQNNVVAGFSTVDGCGSSSGTSKGEIVDQSMMISLRNLGQSMVENIQVIESVFQQDLDPTKQPENSLKNCGVGKGQEVAISALEELRKISTLLSEM